MTDKRPRPAAAGLDRATADLKGTGQHLSWTSLARPVPRGNARQCPTNGDATAFTKLAYFFTHVVLVYSVGDARQRRREAPALWWGLRYVIKLVGYG